MRKPPNKDLVKALKACLEYLAEDMNHARECGLVRMKICHALTRAEIGCKCTFDAAEYLRQRVIMERLGGHGTLNQWLVEEAGIPELDLYAEGRKHLQAHRRAWVGQLIKEFSK